MFVLVCIDILGLYWSFNTYTIRVCLYWEAFFCIGLYSCIGMYWGCIDVYLYVLACIVLVLDECLYWHVLLVSACICTYCVYGM